MKKFLYVIKDVEADSCGPVMDIKNDVVAKRMFKKIVEEQKLDTSIFRLFKIAEYDDESGLVNGTCSPIDITISLDAEDDE